MSESGRYEWLGWGRMATDDLADSTAGLTDRVEGMSLGNGKPEPEPYRYQGRPNWQPSDVDVCRNDFEARQRDQREWAAANAALVAQVRKRLKR